MIKFTDATADGYRAAPIEGEDLVWIVESCRPAAGVPGYYEVLEMERRDLTISAVRLKDENLRGRGFGVIATIQRGYKYEGWPEGGWYLTLRREMHEPYRSAADAFAGLLLDLGQQHRERAARAAGGRI